jgi:hypothetical protein
MEDGDIWESGPVNQDGSFSENWTEGLPEDLRGEQSLAAFQDLPSLAKSFVNTKKLVGANTVKLPGEAATDDERRQFYTALGCPEKPEDYEIARAELPEGQKWDEEAEGRFRQVAHGIGLNKSQVAKVMEYYNNEIVTAAQKQESDFAESLQKGMNALKGKLGGEYAAKRELAMRAISTFAEHDEIKEALTNDIDRDPRIATLFINIGEAISEDVLRGAQPSGFTPTEAQEKLTELMASKAYLDEKDPQHKAIVQRVFELRKMLHGEK